MKFSICLFAALLISGCALLGDDARTQYGKQLSLYNEVAEEIIELREPCVEISANDPRCVLDDESYRKVLIVQAAADGYLKGAEKSLELEDENTAKKLLRQAFAALYSAASYVGLTPKME